MTTSKIFKETALNNDVFSTILFNKHNEFDAKLKLKIAKYLPNDQMQLVNIESKSLLLEDNYENYLIDLQNQIIEKYENISVHHSINNTEMIKKNDKTYCQCLII